MSKAKTAVVRASKTPSVIVNANGYTFTGKLSRQLQELAKQQGRTPDEIVAEALGQKVSPIVVGKDGYSIGGALAKGIQECAKQRGESTDAIVTKALGEFIERQSAEQLAGDGEVAATFTRDDGIIEELLLDRRARLWFLSVKGNVRPASLADALWWYLTRDRLHEHGGHFGTFADEISELFTDVHRELMDFEEFRPQLEAKREERRRGYFARQAA